MGTGSDACYTVAILVLRFSQSSIASSTSLRGNKKEAVSPRFLENIQADSDVLASVSLGPILLNRELCNSSSFRAVSIQRRNKVRYHFLVILSRLFASVILGPRLQEKEEKEVSHEP